MPAPGSTKNVTSKLANRNSVQAACYNDVKSRFNEFLNQEWLGMARETAPYPWLCAMSIIL